MVFEVEGDEGRVWDVPPTWSRELPRLPHSNTTLSVLYKDDTKYVTSPPHFLVQLKTSQNSRLLPVLHSLEAVVRNFHRKSLSVCFLIIFTFDLLDIFSSLPTKSSHIVIIIASKKTYI